MKQITAIHNARLVLGNRIIDDGVLLMQGDTILQCGNAREVAVPQGALSMDAKGQYVGPGFVDIHVHGGNGFSTCFDPKQAADFFLRHGTTSILAAPAYSFDFDKFLCAIETVKAAWQDAPTVRGLYLEGPYTNPDYGANSHRNPWRGPISEAQYKPIVDAAGNLAKVWVIAPEREGLLPFLEYARKVNPHVKFAVGHSEATPAQIRALGQYRPALHTHVTNATGIPSVTSGTRGCGPDEHCFLAPETYAELISDSQGIHVCADMQKLVLHCKGVHRTVLITDSTGLNNPNPPELSHVTDLNFNEQGELAGSRLTMDQALRNVITHTGCSIADAFLMASSNPAQALELNDIGSIAVGKKADLVFLDDTFHVQQVILRGEIK